MAARAFIQRSDLTCPPVRMSLRPDRWRGHFDPYEENGLPKSAATAASRGGSELIAVLLADDMPPDAPELPPSVWRVRRQTAGDSTLRAMAAETELMISGEPLL